MIAGPDISGLSHAQKDALIGSLMAQVAALVARVAELEAKLSLPAKTPDNPSLAIEGTETAGAGRAQGEGQPACGGASPASSRSDIEARLPGLALPRLRRRCFGRRAEPLRELGQLRRYDIAM